MPAGTALLVLGLLSGVAAAQTRDLSLFARRPAPAVPPLIDDATLHDVQLLGDRYGWAVGDRGAVWQTTDGGRTWQRVLCPGDGSLRSVCFLTDRVGWIVGGGIRPYGGGQSGVVLRTEDGGETWIHQQRADADRLLPVLHHVQFFSLQSGVAVGESSETVPTGVLQTSDGGATWQPLGGSMSRGWRAGGLLEPDVGFVAGPQGRFTSIAGGQVQPEPPGASGMRGFVGGVLRADRRGWLVGEGGLILTSSDAGTSWQPPAGVLPRLLRDVMDFRAVAAHGKHVWVAGQPGSVVWHSSDGGQSWASYPTGQTVPLEAIDFSSPTHGCAAGALGLMLLTEDGGRTWEAVRGGGRRAALLAVHAHESRVSLNLLTKYGSEQGYRAVTALVARRDIGADNEAGAAMPLRLQEAALRAGGADSTVDWAFPITAPELDRQASPLIRQWQSLSDNRLRDVMLGRLVTLLRTWRPDVVVIDVPAEDDAATGLLGDALKLAVREAADAASHAELTDTLQLAPWSVARVFRRRSGAEDHVAVEVEPFEFLPRVGSALAMAADAAYGCLNTPNVTHRARELYVPLEEDGTAGIARDLFAGLVLAPGSAARRPLLPLDDATLEQRQQLAQHQRNMQAIAERIRDDPQQAATLVGQVRDVVGLSPPPQAAVQLWNLAEAARRQGDWEQAQALLVELVERYPEEPPAAGAMIWLATFWGSDEVAFQRLRWQASVTRAVVQSANGTAAADAVLAESPVSGAVLAGGAFDEREVKQSAWRSQAERMFAQLKQLHGEQSAAPLVQFPCAALERKLGHPRRADEILQIYRGDVSAGPWARIAAGELWRTQPASLAPPEVVSCVRTDVPPWLDGHLDDECWQRAPRIRLRSEADHRQPDLSSDSDDDSADASRSHVQWACDARFLYLSGRLPRHPALPDDGAHYPGRTHDADLSSFDRLIVTLDTDRDYATSYRFDIDQRGWTADRCWENRSWNCPRYIAVAGDEHEWRLELAIPFSELTSSSPSAGDTWGVTATRVLPGVGLESFTIPAATEPRPDGSGLLWFQ
jgi:photosystem II stability/assembly factor-like uncharacterized protein